MFRSMTPPKVLIRVEWQASRTFDEPDTRGPKARNFTSARDAARQVAVVRSWPSHLELTGVYRPGPGSGAAGVAWEAVDPDELPLHEDDAAELALLAEGRPPAGMIPASTRGEA